MGFKEKDLKMQGAFDFLVNWQYSIYVSVGGTIGYAEDNCFVILVFSGSI